MSYILAIDQGTTSSRAILFDNDLRPVSKGQKEFRQIFPKAGWVEHDPEEIWDTTLATCKEALTQKVAAIGITNQRETVVIWDKVTGKPIYNAIVWQDRRTADYCTGLKASGHEATVTEKTGLLLDPYFSATKINWILNNVEGARAQANAGQLLCGTIDCFLIWRLTGGKIHATDATNASRTMLYNIHSGGWDNDLLALFDVPASMLPEVKDSSAVFGETQAEIFGQSIPIRGVAGDQQAATVGQACFDVGMMKSTYGTGCFAILNTGKQAVQSQNRLLTTIAYQLDGQPTYALEGSIFIAGAVVQWLRDGLGIIDDARETQKLAEAADPEQSVVIVPAFTGLGAPYWDAECHGAIYGLTRNSGPKELAKAALQSVAFQTRDLLEAMRKDWDWGSDTVLRVDGGMTSSDWTMQYLADQLNAPVDRPEVTETTAKGAAYLAGLAIDLHPGLDEFKNTWQLEKRFTPSLNNKDRQKEYDQWTDAVQRTLSQKHSA